jgi:hypothetical protein
MIECLNKNIIPNFSKMDEWIIGMLEEWSFLPIIHYSIIPIN